MAKNILWVTSWCTKFSNIALYVKAHMIFKESPAIVFAGMNILGRVTWCS
jgi:hypothetical protein